MGHLLTFLAGFVCGLATWALWKGLQFAIDLRHARHAIDNYVYPNCGLADEQAQAAIQQCKNRIRWARNPNPEWISPLIKEMPVLIRQIAATYHPTHPDPLLAPGLSQFSRAVQLAAFDLAEFLQTRSVGRLVDVSASTAIRTWEITHKITQHDTFQSLNRVYKWMLPVWQVVKYKSPLTWATMAVSNVAARTLQPAVVDIIAHRAIDLYSGRLGGLKAFEAPARSKDSKAKSGAKG